MAKSCLVSNLIKEFEMEVLNAGNLDKKTISAPGLKHAGIELATGIKVHNIQKSVILLGVSECTYFKSLSPSDLKKTISFLTNLQPPLILLTNAFSDADVKMLLNAIGETPITICRMDMVSDDINLTVAPYIAKQLIKTKAIHGTLVNIYGTGVLITGGSCVGKSEVALEMIKKGHLFVGDDAIEVYKFADDVYGKASDVAKKFIEVRGLGILDVSRMLGIEKIMDESEISIIIELQKWDSNEKIKFERIGEEVKYEKILRTKIVKYILPVTAGRKVSDLIEVAVIDYKLRQRGYNSAKEYLNNFEEVKKKDK